MRANPPPSRTMGRCPRRRGVSSTSSGGSGEGICHRGGGGVNHNGQVDSALLMVEAAQEAGADCVKFQAFGAEELAVKEAIKAPYQ